MYALYRKVQLASIDKIVGTGWLPPLPDLRDFTEEHDQIKQLTQKMRLEPGTLQTLPDKVDLREWCSEIDDQGNLGSCTAHAAASIVEYFEKKSFSKYSHVSRLFIYKATRNLLGVQGDTGAWLRNTMGALAILGAPDEKYWPYTDQNPAFDNEPTSFVYSVANDFRAGKYFCHDALSLNLQPNIVLDNLKKYLAAGIPAMFGFWGFSSFEESDSPGAIPFPCLGEEAQWGHAITAVGYDDSKQITNTRCNKTTVGALLFRNSWGKNWGENGYGWLPYEYVLNKLASDFWSLISMEWIDTQQFGI
ncbi:MAG: papain family cysteine protease [Firmicutes bacterium]|nr:papain family cysteine protease [Bacillota bacterium]